MEAAPKDSADPGLKTKRQRWEKKYVLAAEIEKWTGERTIHEVGEILDRERVANSPILNVQQVCDDPHLNAVGFFRRLEHPTEGTLVTLRPPSRWSRTPPEVRRAPPRLGEHSSELLAEAGYSGAEIAELVAAGVTLAPSHGGG